MITKWLLVYVLEHKHNFHFVIIFDLQWQFLISKNKNTHSLLRMSIKMLREEEKFKKNLTWLDFENCPWGSGPSTGSLGKSFSLKIENLCGNQRRQNFPLICMDLEAQ